MDFLWVLHDLRSPVLTAVFRFFTLFGEEFFAILLLCLLYWCVDKRLAFYVTVSFFASTLVVQGLKVALEVPRPWVLDPAFEPVAEAMTTATGFSFPSGHTQTVTAIFGSIALYYGGRRKGVAAACWVMVALVGFSRMYLGVHTMLDVVAGFAMAMTVCLALRLYALGGRPLGALHGLLGALAVAVAAYALVRYSGGRMERGYLADCLKAAGGCAGCAAGFFWAARRIPFEVRTPKLWQQGVKYLVGLAGILALKEGLKLISGGLVMDFIRYGLMTLWALAVFPLVWTLWGKRKDGTPREA